MKVLAKRRGGRRRHQRGTAYVLVLAITALLVTLGLAANQLAQNQIERGESDHDLAKARLAALYTQDYVHKLINGSLTWRDGITSGNWRYFTMLDGVRIWFAYVDQIDGDLSNDYSEPFVLYTLAICGDAYRLYSVEFSADDAGNLTAIASTFRQEVLGK